MVRHIKKPIAVLTILLIVFSLFPAAVYSDIGETESGETLDVDVAADEDADVAADEDAGVAEAGEEAASEADAVTTDAVTTDAEEVDASDKEVVTDASLNNKNMNSIKGRMSLLGSDGGGGSGGGGTGFGGNIATDGGRAFVWFDRGGWAKDGTEPEQGIFHHGDKDVPDKMFNKFWNMLEAEVRRQVGRENVYFADWSTEFVNRRTYLRSKMVEACERAITRGGDSTQCARVVGVAITWNHPISGAGDPYLEDWCISTDMAYWNGVPHTFKGLFTRPGNSSELTEGWSQYVNVTKYNDALENENWREYIYRIGAIDNKDVEERPWNVYVVAVTDNMPQKEKSIVVQKESSNKGITNGNSCYSMMGITYDVYDNAKCTGTPVASLEITNYDVAASMGKTENASLEFGKYWVKEREASLQGTGYVYDSKVEEIVLDASSPEVVALSFVNDPVSIELDLKIKKMSSESKAPIDAEDLAAVFKLEYWSNYEQTGKPAVWYYESRGGEIMLGDETYLSPKHPSDLLYRENEVPVLPLGSIRIKEVIAPSGFVKTNLNVDAIIKQDSELGMPVVEWQTEQMQDVLTYENEKTLLIYNDPARGDISWFKVDVDGRRIPNLPFLISRLDKNGEVIESHVILTDEEGRLNTSSRPKTGDEVNSLDEFVVDGVYTGPLDEVTGVWFGNQDDRAEGKGALAYGDSTGNYLVEELRCEANEGRDLLKQKMVEDDGLLRDMWTDGRIFELENIFVNLIVHPETDLVDDASGSKIVTIGEAVTVTDSLRWDNLKVGQNYRLRTIIYYEAMDGTVTELGENTVDFVPEKVDSTNTSHGVVANTVTINTAGLVGGRIHAVDEIYAYVAGKEVLIVSHNRDLDIESQTLTVPEIETPEIPSTSNPEPPKEPEVKVPTPDPELPSTPGTPAPVAPKTGDTYNISNHIMVSGVALIAAMTAAIRRRHR